MQLCESRKREIIDIYFLSGSRWGKAGLSQGSGMSPVRVEVRLAGPSQAWIGGLDIGAVGVNPY